MKRRLLKGVALVGLLIALVLGLAPAVFKAVYAWQRDGLPEVIDRAAFDGQLWQTTRVYDRNGEILAEAYRERRTIVPVETLPRHLLEAVVAAEDKRFFQHAGIDWSAIYRAIAVDLVRARLVQGASTLTQQLARNLYYSQERTLARKFNEMLMATRLEQVLTKDEILHQYLNLIYLGHGRYGVEEAAQFYFGKGAATLGLNESILLAGIIKGPEVFSPLRSPEKARRRMDYVGRQMVAAGFISQEQLDALTLPESEPHPRAPSGASPYGVDAVLAQFISQVGRETFDQGGYDLRTTLEPRWQAAMDRAVRDQLPGLQVGLDTADVKPEQLCNCIQEYRVPTGCAIWAQVKQRSRNGDGTVVDVLGRLGRVPDDALDGGSWQSGEDSPVLLPGSYVKVISNQEFELDSPWVTEEILVVPVVRPQVAAVLMEVATGEVRAVYGGVDHRYHPYNRAISARRQIGSTIKPFIYLAAMQTLAWDLDTNIDARCLDLRQADGKRWPIRDSHAHTDRITVREALAISSNCAAVRTLRELGNDLFAELWNRWGLPPLDIVDASLALGSVSLSPMELASAYAMLGHQQCTPQPHLLLRATGGQGLPIALPAKACAGHLPASDVAALAVGLEAVLRAGTGTGAQVDGVRAFGKTGTTSQGRDAWFAGVFTAGQMPPMALVVWVGTDDFSALEGNSGPTHAARVWKTIVQELID